MKNKLITISLLLLLCSVLSLRATTIAILDFSNNCLFDKDKYASLSPGLAEILITELNKIQSIQIVERQKINQLIQEMQLAQSGLVSEETGVQVGKLVGAKYLVFGSYMVFDKKIRVDVRIVEVETGVTIKAE
ncbi:MAG: CsgG/HfaB family protein, partial [bacterium]|nr:CsgG/HfaB family protein [bacterium]